MMKIKKNVAYVFLFFAGGCAFNAVSSSTASRDAAPMKATAPEGHGLLFGVVPQRSPERLKEVWVPLLTKVSTESGIPIEFTSAPSILEFHKKVEGRAYELVYINPNQYVRASNQYSAFARSAKKKLSGILVKRTGDPRIRSVADLKGKKVAFPSGAFAATMINKLIVAKAGINLATGIEISEMPSHEAGYELVAAGKADAVGGVNTTFNNLPPATRSKLEIFNTSEGYSPHPLCALKSVSPEVVKKVQAAFVKVSTDPANQAMMKAVELATLEPVTDRDYDDLRLFSETAELLGIHD